ncbi:hypothetical protein [uncultured Maribacter sp.]|uniref:hypothetical protein n=1 Tax=uncultured Maribacter sp. TaxID=431308 RepID=UPI0030D99DBA
MNIFGPKSFSSFSFYSFRTISIFLLIFLSYIIFAFGTNRFTVLNGRFDMKIPFIESSIRGNYQFSDILTISIILIFGVLFFNILSNIFKALKEIIIFNKDIIRNLKFFTILNLIIGPALYFLIHYPIMKKTDFGDVHNLILLVIFGVISLFLTNIFKTGYTVQSENDLTI